MNSKHDLSCLGKWLIIVTQCEFLAKKKYAKVPDKKEEREWVAECLSYQMSTALRAMTHWGTHAHPFFAGIRVHFGARRGPRP